MPRSIYFDYNATTPLEPEILDAMLPFFRDGWGNPSSVHHIGRKARAHLDEAREKAAFLLGAKPSEIVFTSGGTEANNLAILGTSRLLKSKGRHLITSQIEHASVLECFNYLEKNEGFSVSRLPVDSTGRVSVDSLISAIRPDTVLVSIMAANNEIGSIQPVSALGSLCQERGIIFHSDAVQWFGKEPFVSISQFNANLISICPHKFHGPKGAGILYVKSPLHPFPLLLGGAHENESRAGTENLPAIIGMVKAISKFLLPSVFSRPLLSPLISKLYECIDSIDSCLILTPKQDSLSNTVSFVVNATDGMSLISSLDVEGICASSGSACSAGSLVPSHVVKAINPLLNANGLVRFSLGRYSSQSEVDYVCSLLPAIINRVLRSS